jgi:hypothetical protein
VGMADGLWEGRLVGSRGGRHLKWGVTHVGARAAWGRD